MSVKITSIERINGPHCNHFFVTVNTDGVEDTIRTSEDEMAALIVDLRDVKGDMNVNSFMALIWAAWKVYKRGASKAFILNLDIDI